MKIRLVLFVAVLALAGVTVHAKTHVTETWCWLCALCPF
jgi:hypothetical protein